MSLGQVMRIFMSFSASAIASCCDQAATSAWYCLAASSFEGSAAFRSWLFDQAAPTRIDFLLNNRLWAFDTHPQYTVALLAAERRVPQAR